MTNRDMIEAGVRNRLQNNVVQRDPVTHLHEELLDALVYLAIFARQIKGGDDWRDMSPERHERIVEIIMRGYDSYVAYPDRRDNRLIESGIFQAIIPILMFMRGE